MLSETSCFMLVVNTLKLRFGTLQTMLVSRPENLLLCSKLSVSSVLCVARCWCRKCSILLPSDRMFMSTSPINFEEWSVCISLGDMLLGPILIANLVLLVTLTWWVIMLISFLSYEVFGSEGAFLFIHTSCVSLCLHTTQCCCVLLLRVERHSFY